MRHDTLQELINNLAPADAAQLASALGDIVFDTLAVSILKTMPDSKVAEFGRLLDEGNTAQAIAFVRKHTMGLDSAMDNALRQMRAEAHIMLAAV